MPYQKNKRILLINLQFKLYAQRDPSTYTTPQVSPENSENSESQNNGKTSK